MVRVQTSALLVVLSIVMYACSEGSTEASSTAPADTGKTLASQLAAADAADGATDKVVTKCAGCALSMDGMEEHALDLSGYSLRFCGAGCKDGFADGAEEKLLALSIPEK